MNPPPTAVGLFVCQQVIIDKDTLNPSCIGIFTRFAVDQLPSVPRPISVFASLTDAHGNGTMQIVISELAEGHRIYGQTWPITFPDRLTVVNVRIRLTQLSFPKVGQYAFSLLVDDDIIAERTLTVHQRK